MLTPPTHETQMINEMKEMETTAWGRKGPLYLPTIYLHTSDLPTCRTFGVTYHEFQPSLSFSLARLRSDVDSINQYQFIQDKKVHQPRQTRNDLQKNQARSRVAQDCPVRARRTWVRGL